MRTRPEFRTITTVTVGGLLEWYEFSLYAYLAPVFAHVFFPSTAELLAIIYVFGIFAIGFLSRPLGALLFGYIGDRYGRRIALFSSIMMITVPTIVIGLLPSYEKIGLLAPLVLLLMRLLQGLLVGGEIPGSICYLVESVPTYRRRFISSWAFFGSQIGAILAILESLYLEKHLSVSDLVSWGWRASFLAGGGVGLCACFLRYGLKETPVFEDMTKTHKVSTSPLIESLHFHKKSVLLGFCVSALPMAGDFLFFTFSPVYFEKIIGMSFERSLMIVGILLALSTLFLPIFGKLNNKYKNKGLLIASGVGIMLLTYPFYFAAANVSVPFMLLFGILLILLLSCYFALFPLFIAELFPSAVRYSCVGMSYNLSSSFVGGIAPVLALYLIRLSNDPAIPALVLLVTGLLSVTALFLIKAPKHSLS